MPKDTMFPLKQGYIDEVRFIVEGGDLQLTEDEIVDVVEFMLDDDELQDQLYSAISRGVERLENRR